MVLLWWNYAIECWGSLVCLSPLTANSPHVLTSLGRGPETGRWIWKRFGQWLRRWWCISGAHWTQARYYKIGETDKSVLISDEQAKDGHILLAHSACTSVVVCLTSFDLKQAGPTLEHPQAVDLVVWWRLEVIKYSKDQPLWEITTPEKRLISSIIKGELIAQLS